MAVLQNLQSLSDTVWQLCIYPHPQPGTTRVNVSYKFYRTVGYEYETHRIHRTAGYRYEKPKRLTKPVGYG